MSDDRFRCSQCRGAKVIAATPKAQEVIDAFRSFGARPVSMRMLCARLDLKPATVLGRLVWMQARGMVESFTRQHEHHAVYVLQRTDYRCPTCGGAGTLRLSVPLQETLDICRWLERANKLVTLRAVRQELRSIGRAAGHVVDSRMRKLVEYELLVKNEYYCTEDGGSTWERRGGQHYYVVRPRGEL